MKYKKELDIAINLALEAGEEILKIYNSDFEFEVKEDSTPLTIADKNANEIIVNGLNKNFPSYSVLSEESKDDGKRKSNKYCWIVDPLDGTKEFIKRNDEFTVNIALVKNGEPLLGVIYTPALKELYYAHKSSGAFYKDSYGTGKINVSDKSDDFKLLISRSHQTSKEKMLIKENEHRISYVEAIGSSLKGCRIAKGDAEIYYRFGPTYEWDIAAQQIIVEEAGGIFLRLDNKRFKYNRENPLNEIGFYVLNDISSKLL
ncbi:MAG: 3'(2'),5'-bisphosphate nucleotidase CysQ [Acidaminobacteraceae bacterium]